MRTLEQIPDSIGDSSELALPILKGEVKRVIKQIKSNKAPGPDRVSLE